MSLRHGFLFALAALFSVALIPAVAPASTLLYQEVFGPPYGTANSTSALQPWTVNMVGGYMGAYSGSYDPLGMTDAATGLPIGRTGPADTAGTGIYAGSGGTTPVSTDLRAFYTKDGQGGFSSFDPDEDCKDCYFNVWTKVSGGLANAANDPGYFVIGQIDNSTNAYKWYASTSPMLESTHNGGAIWDLRSLKFNPALGNWQVLNVTDGSLAVAPTLGAITAFPAGTIDGVGILSSVTNASGVFAAWDFADYRVTCGGPATANRVPEPASLLLMVCGGVAVLWFRRAK